MLNFATQFVLTTPLCKKDNNTNFGNLQEKYINFMLNILILNSLDLLKNKKYNIHVIFRGLAI